MVLTSRVKTIKITICIERQSSEFDPTPKKTFILGQGETGFKTVIAETERETAEFERLE